MKRMRAGAAWILMGLMIVVRMLTGPVALAAGPTFQVRPVYPENQRERNGYFDIRMAPGQRQELTLQVINAESKPLRVEVELVNASTAPDGFIDYITPDIRDESMAHPFTQLASLPRTVVEVPAEGQADIVLTVEAPPESFDGMILGGVRVLKIEEEVQEGMITNAYQYAVAVAITENDTPVAPDFQLLDVTTGLENYRAAVTASVRNSMPAPAKEVATLTQLFRDGERDAVYTLEKEIDVAPNSVWDCVLVDQAGYGFSAGNYLLRMRMEWDETEWEFEHRFTITSTDADYMSNNAVNQQQGGASATPGWVWIIVIIGVLLLLLLIILMFLLLRKKKEA